MPLARWLLATVTLAATGTAWSQAPSPETDKLDAKALMQSGLKLYAARDFLGALAVFKTAYTRFASAKILLNIGTTLTKLDRKAEAANVYQRYLDSPDADPAKRNEVKKVLAELDAAVAEGRPHRPSGELAAHVVETMEAIARSAESGRPVELESSFDRPPPMPWAA